MQRKQLESRAYVKPAVNVCTVQTESFLHASGNAGTIGGGGSAGDAKQGWFDEEEDEPAQLGGNYSAWEE